MRTCWNCACGARRRARCSASRQRYGACSTWQPIHHESFRHSSTIRCSHRWSAVTPDCEFRAHGTHSNARSVLCSVSRSASQRDARSPDDLVERIGQPVSTGECELTHLFPLSGGARARGSRRARPDLRAYQCSSCAGRRGEGWSRLERLCRGRDRRAYGAAWNRDLDRPVRGAAGARGTGRVSGRRSRPSTESRLRLTRPSRPVRWKRAPMPGGRGEATRPCTSGARPTSLESAGSPAPRLAAAPPCPPRTPVEGDRADSPVAEGYVETSPEPWRRRALAALVRQAACTRFETSSGRC